MYSLCDLVVGRVLLKIVDWREEELKLGRSETGRHAVLQSDNQTFEPVANHQHAHFLDDGLSWYSTVFVHRCHCLRLAVQSRESQSQERLVRAVFGTVGEACVVLHVIHVLPERGDGRRVVGEDAKQVVVQLVDDVVVHNRFEFSRKEVVITGILSVE